MRRPHRGLAATTVLILCLVAACADDAERAPLSTPPASPSVASAVPTSTGAPTTTVVATTSATTIAPTTAAPNTEAPTTTVGLAPDQQPESADEIRMLLVSVPTSESEDPEAAAVRASVEGALTRLTDGSLSQDDYFLATGDYVPDGVVLSSYLVCPLSIGDHCQATVPDYERFATQVCGGRPIITAIVEGPNGPAGAGTCWWRPTAEQMDAAADVVHEALGAVVADTVQSTMTFTDEAGIAAQAYAEFRAAHPFEQPLTSNVDGAAAVRAALRPVLAGDGRVCDSWWFIDSMDDTNRAERLAQISDRVRDEVATYFPRDVIMGDNPTNAGVGSAVGSGQLVVAWCVYGTS